MMVMSRSRLVFEAPDFVSVVLENRHSGLLLRLLVPLRAQRCADTVLVYGFWMRDCRESAGKQAPS